MIRVYLDESQQTEKARHVVIAGYCGTDAQWETFLPDWKQTLAPRTHLHLNSIRWNASGG
jgi:hypothetical protein